MEAGQGSRTNILLVPIAAEQLSEQQNVTRDMMQQQIQSCISAAIPDITTSVITALTVYGIIMARTSIQWDDDDEVHFVRWVGIVLC